MLAETYEAEALANALLRALSPDCYERLVSLIPGHRTEEVRTMVKSMLLESSLNCWSGSETAEGFADFHEENTPSKTLVATLLKSLRDAELWSSCRRYLH